MVIKYRLGLKKLLIDIVNGKNQRFQYFVSYCPTAASHSAPWAIFRAAILSWRALTTEQKAKLNDRARHHNTMSGYNLYIKEYILANY